MLRLNAAAKRCGLTQVLAILGNIPPAFDDLAQRWLSFAINQHPDSNPGDDPNFVAFMDFDWLVTDDPEQAWATILEVLSKTDSLQVLGQLAAGPLEDLLSNHGEHFIDRTEELARIDPKFAVLLGGVWKFQITDPIWERIGYVANRAAWNIAQDG